MRRFQKNNQRRRKFSQKPSHRRRPHQRPNRSNHAPDQNQRKFFASVAIDPSPRIRLEEGCNELTMRAMDLICPIGMGQRGLIVAPPGSGKTTFLKHICQAISKSCPDVKLYCLLIDERPEEVTDFKRSVSAEVHYSSLDDTYDHHVKVADTLMKRAYQEAGDGADVVVVVDSLTRLARVHNVEKRSSGRTLSGGVDASALEVPRRIFGSARKIENGGSLSILASILVDTGSKMDQVIFEEFKGTGNMEIVLSREIANQRIYPAIDIAKSRTRKEEKLLTDDEHDAMVKIRRVLAEMNSLEATKTLIEQLKKHDTNAQLLASLKR